MADPMEEVRKRMQGMLDSRSKVGELSRGKNMYLGGNAAQSGPGGPDMGRPPLSPQMAAAQQSIAGANAAQSAMNLRNQQAAPQAQVPQAAAQAVMNKTGNVLPQAAEHGQATALAARSKTKALTNRKASGLAKAALQAAAQRKMNRSR
jgi:hypothetical protein